MTRPHDALRAWLERVQRGAQVDDDLRLAAARAVAGDPDLTHRLGELLRSATALDGETGTPDGRNVPARRTADTHLAEQIHPLKDARQWWTAGEDTHDLGTLLAPPPGVTYLVHRASTRRKPRQIWWFEPGAPTSGVAMARVCEDLAQRSDDALFIAADYFLSRPPEASAGRFRVSFRVDQMTQGLSRLHLRFPDAELRMVGVSFGASSGLLAAPRLALPRIRFHLYGLVVPGNINEFTRQFAWLTDLERAACRLPGRSAAVSRFVVGSFMAALSLRTYPRRHQREMTRYNVQAVRMGLLDLDEMYRAVREVKHLDVAPGEELAHELRQALRDDPRVHCGADPSDPWVNREVLETAGSRAAWFPETGHSPFELPERDEALMRWLLG